MLLLIIFLVLVVYLLWWIVQPALTLTKTTPVHPASLTFSDPTLDPHTLIPFPSLYDPPSLYISLIAPAYNEEGRLPGMLEKTLRYLSLRAMEDPDFTFEVIVVNDGSRDHTASVALSFVERYGSDHVRLLNMGVNRGKGAAVRQGMRSARGRMLLMLDSDGATEISDLARLERCIENCDTPDLAIAIGDRKANVQSDSVERTQMRAFLSWGFNFFVRLLLVPQHDTQCGFKLFTRRAAQAVFASQHVERWAFDLELLFVAQHYFKIHVEEVPVNWVEVEGSKMTLGGLLNMARDIFMIRVLYLIGVWKVQRNQAVSL